MLQAIDDLLTLLTEANITIITSESFAVSPKNQVENIKVSEYDYSLIAFDERVTFWLQRVRPLPCACVYVALFARRLSYNQGFWIYLIYFRIRHSFTHLRTILIKMASFGVNSYRPSASEHGQNITNITMI